MVARLIKIWYMILLLLSAKPMTPKEMPARCGPARGTREMEGGGEPVAEISYVDYLEITPPQASS